MKRMILAVVLMLAVSTLAKELISLAEPSDINPWQVEPGIIGLLAACLGGFIARAHFVPIALLVHAVVWLVILYTLRLITNGQSSYVDLAAYNAVAMAISFPLVALGAYLGQRLSRLRGSRASAAA